MSLTSTTTLIPRHPQIDTRNYANELAKFPFGGIPKQLGNLTSLKQLALGNNKLTGEIPNELGALELEVFSIGRNGITGTIPDSIFNISTLKVLDLNLNPLSGNLPSTMGRNLGNLERLYLSNTSLYGRIPSSITNASKLTLLDMGFNSFTGPIPSFGNLRLLEILVLEDNKLTDESQTGQLEFLSSLVNCQRLRVLDVNLNPLNGSLPATIGNLSTSLLSFYAGPCNLRGGIPAEIGNLTSLQKIMLSLNSLTGVLPKSLGNLKDLQEIYLGYNQLEGFIPQELCKMTKLGLLILVGNKLNGPIPECIGELKSLRNVLLNVNKLSSSIPASFWDLSDLVEINLSANFLSGTISNSIGNFKVLTALDLSLNQFNGSIPSSIEGCQTLTFLSLANNMFEGQIPESMGTMRGLDTLDLSNNSLEGMIPKSLEQLPFLQSFNVSYNKLKGEIPTQGRFLNFTALSFIHNHALCGLARFQVPPCNENKRRHALSLMKYIMPPIVSSIILVILIILIIRRRKKGQILMHGNNITTDIVFWRRISYAELLQGTDSFSEANRLGTGSFGSIFKGTLLDGLVVAVKVFNLEIERAVRSFDTECEVLSNVRHRNLVRVLGCCSNEDFKALVLEYMPNGSLERWLYQDERPLDLLQRLNIAVDVASGLEYLHFGHTFPIVHCDIKPSNVLLDADMVARVSDFGISKLFTEGQDVIQTNTLGTIGYAAPECGSEGKVSMSGDVYGYGIMLLEIFTGKKPTDSMFTEEMNIKNWVNEALRGNSAAEVVAPVLLPSEDEHYMGTLECVMSVFEVAMQCLAISPEERINMVKAVASLQKIKAKVVASTRKHK